MRRVVWLTLAGLLPLAGARAATDYTWNRASSITGNWSTATNWNPSGIPGNGDSVKITNGFVLLTNSSAALAAFAITNARLFFRNWDTKLDATNVTVSKNGMLTMQSAFYNTAGQSNNIYVACSNFTLEDGGQIYAYMRGYAMTSGPGKGTREYTGSDDCGAGGGHGGRGGGADGFGGLRYGSASAPINPGSGGGLGYNTGRGGGAVRIEATGCVTIDGTVNANGGGHADQGGGGSGGSIYITCASFGGSTNGILQADGGDGGATIKGGGGGGGRIAVHYASLVDTPGVRFSANCGGVSEYTVSQNAVDRRTFAPGIGTISFTDVSILNNFLEASGGVLSEFYGSVSFVSTNVWALDSLVVSNADVGADDGFTWQITNDLTVVTGGVLEVEANASLLCGGNLILTNSARMLVYAGATNEVLDYGSLVVVSNTLAVAANCWIYPFSHGTTNGGSPLLRVGGLVIQADGGIDATGRGYAGSYGPGKGRDWTISNYGAGGGGYGGKGCWGFGSTATGGVAYGSATAPLEPGSPGGLGYGAASLYSNGGGAARIEAAGNVTIDGAMYANGIRAYDNRAAGSGGAIFLLCASFGGSATAALLAEGGVGSNGGSGGGGRIAIGIGFSDEDRSKLLAGEDIPGLFIYQQDELFTGTISVTNGNGRYDPPDSKAADPGTLRFMRVLTNGQCGVTIEGSPAQYGAPTTNGYGTFTIPAGTVFTNSVTSPANEANCERWACYGWRVNTNEGGTNVGGEFASGASTQAVFTVNTNLILTWLWTNEYQLTVSAGPNGSVNTGAVNGFYTNGVAVTGILATAADGYYFVAWDGNVPVGQEADNPLTALMDRARTNITAVFASQTSGGPMIWDGKGNWTSVTNWTPNGLPGSNDLVILRSGTVMVSQAQSIGALIVSNTLVFSNWNTCLTVASNVIVAGSGVMTLPAAFTNNQMSNRVWVASSNFTLAAGGQVFADECGYAAENGPGCGVDAGTGGAGGGGGYGGCGGRGTALGGSPYGATNAPLDPGSGGGSAPSGQTGAAGGGAVRIVATGCVTIEGTMSANGGNGASVRGGGGSGGAIYITCASFSGSTNGLLRANGGKGGSTPAGGGGGGGRIAVNYTSLVGTPGVRVSANCGASLYSVDVNSADRAASQMGAIWFPDSSLLDNVLAARGGVGSDLNGYFVFQATNVWAPRISVVSNATLGIPEGYTWQVTNNLTISTGGVVVSAYGILGCSGNLTLTNNASLLVYSGATNEAYTNYGALVGVTNMLSIATNCNIYPFSASYATNGGSALFRVGSLAIMDGGGINADGRGYAREQGTGYGGNGSASGGNGGSGGGGYGGKGGSRQDGTKGGGAYGSTNAPLEPGSGGGTGGGSSTYYGGPGGGLVRIEASGAVRLDGTVSANGINGSVNFGGGGSGGAIYMICKSFSGSATGSLLADGGSASATYSGGGGGGRIAVWVDVSRGMRTRYLNGETVRAIVPTPDWPLFSGTLSVTNGTGIYDYPATNGAYPGTCFFFKYTKGTQIRIF